MADLSTREVLQPGNFLSRVDDALVRFATRPRRLIGLALLRMILGIAVIEYYVSDLAHRRFLWGPHGVVDFNAFRRSIPAGQFSLFALSRSSAWFEFVFFAGLAVAVAYTIFGGRVLALLLAVTTWSIHLRNGLILQGGDNFIQIAVLLLPLCITDAYLTPLARRRRAKVWHRQDDVTLINALHNFGVFAIVFEVCVLYFFAGLWKVHGETWLNGTAIYYILRNQFFHFSPLLTRWTANPFVTTGISYYTFTIELAFPFLVFNRRTWLRRLEVASVALLHVGIMFAMGLVGFGLVMISADCVAVRDDDYRAIAEWARERLMRVPWLQAPKQLKALPISRTL